jgi:hypothetical protein
VLFWILTHAGLRDLAVSLANPILILARGAVDAGRSSRRGHVHICGAVVACGIDACRSLVLTGSAVGADRGTCRRVRACAAVGTGNDARLRFA